METKTQTTKEQSASQNRVAVEAPIKTWAKAIVAVSSYPDAMVEGLAAEHAKVLAQRDHYKASAEALAEQIETVRELRELDKKSFAEREAELLRVGKRYLEEIIKLQGKTGALAEALRPFAYALTRGDVHSDTELFTIGKWAVYGRDLQQASAALAAHGEVK